MRSFIFFLVLIFFGLSYSSYKKHALPIIANDESAGKKELIKTGADQTEKYLPYLKGKRIGLLGNQTTIIGKTHLVDSLKSLGVNIVTVFGPEHGFRGNASNGVKVQDEVDQATGIPIVSLYGSK